MTTKGQREYSDLPIPPGEILAEEIEVRGMTQRELAARLGRPAQVVNEIIRGKKAITPDTAIGLCQVLGIEASYWMNLESDYQMTLARERSKAELSDQEQWLSQYPVSELIKRNWIYAGRDRSSRVRALMSFLEVASIEPRVYQEAVGFRITDAAREKISLGALAAWLRQGELDAERIETAEYNAEAFQRALAEIRHLTVQPPEEFLPRMETLCADAGVAFCVVQELPRLGANGAARWLNDSKALIQMNIRGKWADVFWFSFFHEAGHLLRHRHQRRIVVDGLDVDPDAAAMEAEADEFARDFLIDPEQWRDFSGLGYFDAGDVNEFAHEVGVAPFIVLGRLQKEGLVPYNRFAGMKRRYKWSQ